MCKILRKGASVAIAAAIIFPTLLLLAMWAVNQVYIAAHSTSARISLEAARMMEEIENVRGSMYKSSSQVLVTFRNYGVTNVIITQLYVNAELTTTTFNGVIDFRYSNIGVTGLLNVSCTPPTAIQEGVGLIVPSGQSVTVTLTFSSDIQKITLLAVTASGKVVPISEQSQESQQGVAATLIFFSIPTLTDLLSRSDVSINSRLLAPASPSKPGTGISGGNSYSGVYCLHAVYTDVSIKGTVYYTSAYVGFDASWTTNRAGDPRYTMLITTTPRWGGSLTIGSDLYTFSSYKAYRVVIYGYKGYIKVYYKYYNPTSGTWEAKRRDNSINPSNVIGIYLYGQYYGYSTCRKSSYIQLNGRAEKVYVYVRTSSCGTSTEVSYTPYMVLGDFDNNGLPEMLFTTEDTLFDIDTDWVGNDLDTVKYGWSYTDLNDVSREPFRITFTGYPIDSNKYVAVQVAYRYYFHDNAALDEEEIDTNAWIVRFVLMDSATGDEAAWYELRYQTLTRFEDTYPPDWDYRIDTILLLVPQTGHIYYLAIEFRDPYPALSKYDDADIMIGVEYLSMTFVYQP